MMLQGEWSDIISDDPRAIISLSRVALIVNEFFNLDTDDEVKYDTPFVWWNRSKHNFGISLPMPKPISFVGVGVNGPLWHQEQIIHWFAQWRDLEVPECRQAGDSISSRGHFVPSTHRNEM